MMRAISGDKVSVLPSGKSPRRKPIPGQLVALEPLDPTVHSTSLYALSHETVEAKALWKYMPDGPFDDLPSFEKWLSQFAAAPDRVGFAVHDPHTNRAAGMAAYLGIRPLDGSIEMGYIWFAPYLQRTPQSTETYFLMLRHAFDELSYRRMEWKCDALNQRSRVAALRLGFTFEGIFYQDRVVKGHNRDTAWYSILDSEWPTLRANFETWLAPENFDAAGRQRRSLTSLNQTAT